MNPENNETLTRQQPKMPSYFRQNRIGRDSLLSQIGAVNDEYRNLFNILCDTMEPELPYKKLISKMLPKYPAIVEMLDTLMRILQDGRCGIILKTIKDNQLINDRIILTDRDSPVFWYWYIENNWLSLEISNQKPYPMLESYQSLSGFSADILQRLILADISNSFIDEHVNELVIYSIQVENNSRIIVTPATLSIMLEISRSKIEHIIINSLQLQTEFSRLLGIPNQGLLSSISGKNDKFWFQLTQLMTQNSADLKAKKIVLPDGLKVAASILLGFVQNELQVEEKNEKDQEEKIKAMKGILVAIAAKRDFIVTTEEFTQLFEPHLDRWPDMQTDFGNHYMTDSGRSGLPIVVNVGTDYIYRDHLYILFKTLHSTAVAEMREHYVKRFSEILRFHKNNKISAFSSLDSFRNDIQDRLNRDYVILNSFISKPRLVADGIIHYGTKVLKKSDMSRLKRVLEKYFVPGTVHFRAIDELFGLELIQVFEEAFAQMMPFRRFFMRISGKYESYLSIFNPMIRYDDDHQQNTQKKKKKPRKNPPQKISRKKSSAGSKMNGAKEPRLKSENRTPKEKVKRVTQSKMYTDKQRENVWSEYKDIHKKE